MNVFDNLQDTLFDTVTQTMGYPATWQPTAGGDPLSGEVLYRGPTEKEKLNDVNFNPQSVRMEYKKGVFDGLKAAADDNSNEVVIIDSIGEFYVRSVSQKFDGKNFEAMLEVKQLL